MVRDVTTTAGTVTTNFALLCPAAFGADRAVVHGSSRDRQGVAGDHLARFVRDGAGFAPAGMQHDQDAALVCGNASRWSDRVTR